MPIAFGVAAVILLVAGVRGKTTDLVTLIKSDFTGQPNYFEWMVAIILVGAVGYVDELKTISRMFLGLLVLSLLWSNKNVFSQFTAQETQQPAQQPTSMFPNFPTMPNLPSAPSNSTLPNFPTMPGFSEIPQSNFPTF
jgi:hypothetical protein